MTTPMWFVVMNWEGRFLAIPETPREGTAGERPLPPEWGDLDLAARFPSRAAAGLAAAGNRGSVLTLAEAWKIT